MPDQPVLSLIRSFFRSCLWFFFFSSRRRHTRSDRDWSSDVCSSDLLLLLQIGPVPVRDVRVRHERLQALHAARIGADVEPVGVERRPEQLNLCLRRRLLGGADVAEEPRADEADEQAEDDDHDEQLDQREAALVTESLDEPAASHSATSLIEKMAISMATTMNATSTPITRMIVGSSRPSVRFISIRTSVSSVSATLSSISSIRPVSSPTRTMCMAIAGNMP